MKARLLSLIVLLTSCASAAQANTITFTTILNGTTEIPANASPGTGTALITLDLDLFTMRVQAEFEDLIGTTTASHIHCCTTVPGGANVGVATNLPSFTGFPLGVQAGTYDHTFDLTLASSWNPAFVTAQGGISNAIAALELGMSTGNAYFNIHTTQFPGGEIRGLLDNVDTAAIPEPGSMLLLASGLAGAGLNRWRRRSTNR